MSFRSIFINRYSFFTTDVVNTMYDFKHIDKFCFSYIQFELSLPESNVQIPDKLKSFFRIGWLI